MSPIAEERMNDESHHEQERWRVDKHIPVALILTLIGQGAGIIWWGSSMQHAIQDHERRIVAQETTKTSERMAVVESQIKASRELQIEMNQKLDRLLDHGTGKQR